MRKRYQNLCKTHLLSETKVSENVSIVFMINDHLLINKVTDKRSRKNPEDIADAIAIYLQYS